MVEVCVDSAESALAAAHGGASRLELCSNLLDGGLSPSGGLLRFLKRKRGLSIPIFVMIRPRGGDFVYSEDEVSVMEEEIQVFKDLGADGFVFGILTEDGRVDIKGCRRLLDQCGGRPVTFHRAIDVSTDWKESLHSIIELGFHRVLTSGCAVSAEKGILTIQQMVQLAQNRLVVMPGSGINESNVQKVLKETSASEIHSSASNVVEQTERYAIPMGRTESLKRLVTDTDKVARIVRIFNETRSLLE